MGVACSLAWYALWFRVLGDHWYVERLYSLAIAIATATLIAIIWRRLFETHGQGGADFEWLPILIWIAVPVVSWTIVGNLLETTVAFFTTLATLAALCGIYSPSAVKGAAWGMLSGVAVVVWLFVASAIASQWANPAAQAGTVGKLAITI